MKYAVVANAPINLPPHVRRYLRRTAKARRARIARNHRRLARRIAGR